MGLVDKSRHLREEFIGLTKIPRIKGTILENEIQELFQSNNIDISEFHGQCYDGAANMSEKNRRLSNYSKGNT